MDGELIYIIFSFAPCFFFHLHHTTTCIFKLTHNVTLGVCFLFFDIYIYIYIQTCHVGSIWTYLTGMYESYGWR